MHPETSYVWDTYANVITAIANAGDQRLFAVGKEGRIFIVQPDGTWSSDPFLNIEDDISIANWEEGLLGLAFHPQYPAVPFFFVSYTDKDHKIIIERFQVKASDPNHADKNNRVKLLTIARLAPAADVYRVHNSGDLHFGPNDGYLYASFGDGGPDPVGIGGATGDPHNSGQRKDILLGNMIRIDVDENGANNPDCGQGGYTIPPNNPFIDGPGGQCDEIWATGFRNPWRFSFDSQTADLYLGDVGEALREEINFQPANSPGGENYGWHCYEGNVDYRTVNPGVSATCPTSTVFTKPIYEYDHSAGCSVIGGYVYRGQKYGKLFGRYLFADFCSRQMWMLTRSGPNSWTRSPATSTDFQFSAFGEDANGELYAANYAGWVPPDRNSDIRRVKAQ